MLLALRSLWERATGSATGSATSVGNNDAGVTVFIDQRRKRRQNPLQEDRTPPLRVYRIPAEWLAMMLSGAITDEELVLLEAARHKERPVLA